MAKRTRRRRRGVCRAGAQGVSCSLSDASEWLLLAVALSVVGDVGRRELRRIAARLARQPEVVLAVVEVLLPAVEVPVAHARRQAARDRPAEGQEVRHGGGVERGVLVDADQQRGVGDDGAGDERCQQHRHSGHGVRSLHTVAPGEGHGQHQLADEEPAAGDGDGRAHAVHVVVGGDDGAEHRDDGEAAGDGKGLAHDVSALRWCGAAAFPVR